MTRRPITAHAYLENARAADYRHRSRLSHIITRLAIAAGLLLYILTHALATWQP